MNVEDFLRHPAPILDVRSPSEFLQGHIPGALSFPLFSDIERMEVGTLYKKEGHDAAVRLGLKFIGPKLASLVEKADQISHSTKTFRMYCWRGGMRSSSLAWLLKTAGFDCIVLTKGYKAFRGWALNQFKKSYPLIVLGGLTGSGKTDLLWELKRQNEHILDLEALANHRGSSFGHLGCSPQPSAEHFENNLAWQLAQFDGKSSIWIEDESRMIGTCPIPQPLWKQMSEASFFWIQCPKADRVKRLLSSYGEYPLEDMSQATQRLVKKLGAVRTKEVIQFIQNQDLENAISTILDYYDQAYLHACQKRNRERIEFNYSGSVLELVDQLKTRNESL